MIALAVICGLSAWTIEYTVGCGVRQAEVNGRCCDLCPPGEYAKDFCSEHNQTLCSPCEAGHYSDHYNIFDRCEECQSCQQEYAEKCTPTTNANCSCRLGFLCSNNVCSNCEENKCVMGEKPKRTATPLGAELIEYSYQCEPGHETHRHGVNFLHVILGIGFILLALTLLVILTYVCIKNLRKPREPNNPVIAVSTNTNDFHLSKEESGVQLVIQDEFKNSDSFGHLLLEQVSAFG